MTFTVNSALLSHLTKKGDGALGALGTKTKEVSKSNLWKKSRAAAVHRAQVSAERQPSGGGSEEKDKGQQENLGVLEHVAQGFFKIFQVYHVKFLGKIIKVIIS